MYLQKSSFSSLFRAYMSITFLLGSKVQKAAPPAPGALIHNPSRPVEPVIPQKNTLYPPLFSSNNINEEYWTMSYMFWEMLSSSDSGVPLGATIS